MLETFQEIANAVSKLKAPSERPVERKPIQDPKKQQHEQVSLVKERNSYFSNI